MRASIYKGQIVKSQRLRYKEVHCSCIMPFTICTCIPILSLHAGFASFYYYILPPGWVPLSPSSGSIVAWVIYTCTCTCTCHKPGRQCTASIYWPNTTRHKSKAKSSLSLCCITSQPIMSQYYINFTK